MKLSIISNEHIYFGITIATLVALLFNLLGSVGLIIYGILILFSCFFFIANIRRQNFLFSISSISAITFYLYFILALFINGSYSLYASSVFQFFLLTIISFYIRNNEDLLSDIYMIAKIYIIASLIMGLGSILVSVITTLCPNLINLLPELIKNKFYKITGTFPNRIGGFTENPNTTAILCTVGFTLSILISTSTKVSKKWKIISLFNILISLYMVFIATCSRTSMITCFIFAVSYFALYFLSLNRKNPVKRKIFRLTIILGILVVCIFLLALLISPDFRNYFFNHIIRVDSLATGSQRIPLYKKALELVKDNLAFGYNIKDLGYPHAHNLLLQVLSFSGVPGLILFCIYALSTLIVAIKNITSKSMLIYEIRMLNCFCLSFLLCFMAYGITEGGALTNMRAISIFAPVVFGFTNVINNNISKG